MDITYQPAPEILKRLAEVDFVAIIAPTATGKSVTLREACKWYPDIHIVPDITSRAPRPGEEEIGDYIFRSREEMEAKIARAEYVQVAPNMFGYLYATEPDGYSTEGVAVMPILAEAVPVFRGLPFKSMKTIYMTPPSWDVWQERLKSHSFTLDQLKSRIHEAVESMRFGLNDEDTKFIVNDDLELAAEDFATLALGKPMPGRLKADQKRAREIIQSLLDRFESETSTPKS